MRKGILSIVLLWLCSIATYAQEITSDDGNNQHPGLIKNPSFEDEAKPIRNRRFGPNGEGELFGGYLPAGIIPGWFVIDGKERTSKIETTAENLLDATQHKALCWTITQASATLPVAIANVGFHGIETIEGHKYTLIFWARADKQYKGNIQVGLQSKSDGIWYAQSSVKGKIKKRWKKYTLTFTAEQSDENARFVIMTDKPGTLYLDEVSLYSPAAIKR